ncbi:HIT domain-containing protein, partial [Xanthomonas citri pv. citri]|nr:HIT domain-containing protein [Xanthomonas citri pv. citri]
LNFKNITPQTPIHILFIPKNKTIPTLNNIQPTQTHLINKLTLTTTKYTHHKNFTQNNYHIIINYHKNTKQTIFHIHLHLLTNTPLNH